MWNDVIFTCYSHGVLGTSKYSSILKRQSSTKLPLKLGISTLTSQKGWRQYEPECEWECLELVLFFHSLHIFLEQIKHSMKLFFDLIDAFLNRNTLFMFFPNISFHTWKTCAIHHGDQELNRKYQCYLFLLKVELHQRNPFCWLPLNEWLQWVYCYL